MQTLTSSVDLSLYINELSDNIQKIIWNKWQEEKVQEILELIKKGISELLEEAQRKIVEKNIEWLSNISHCIYNQLAWPIWFADFLESNSWNLSELQRKIINELNISLLKVEKNVWHFMLLLKWEITETNEINIFELIDSLIKYINSISKYLDKGIQIKIKDFEDSWEIIIKWISVEIETCLRYLLRNAMDEALKFSNWTVELEYIVWKDWYLYILISNPWIIPDEILWKIFNENCIKSSKDDWNWLGCFQANTFAKNNWWDVVLLWNSEELWVKICLRLPIEKDDIL